MTHHTFTSSLKKIAYIGAFLFIFLTTQTHAAVIPPGNFSTCGEFAAPGTYTLTADITDNSTCQVTSSGVEIDTNGFEFTVTMEVANWANWTQDSSGWGGVQVWEFNNDSINYGNINGDAIFNNGSMNYGNINGDVTFNSGAYNPGGQIDGNVTFNTEYFGYGTINGDVIVTSSVFDSDNIGNDGPDDGLNVSGTITFTSLVPVTFILRDSYIWTTDTSSWDFSAGGTPTWEFYDYSYNQAIINGDAIFNNYSSNNSGTISGDAIFNNNSLNQGTISGDAVFEGASYNNSNAIINGNANFTASIFDSDNIPNADPTGILNGGTINGNITFTSQTPVTFTLRNSDMWIADNSSWDFSAGGTPTWEFYDSSMNYGTINGDAVFEGASYNNSNAIINGNANFTASIFDSDNIPNADPTGISNGGSISGTITFSSQTPVTFTLRNSDIWTTDTSSWDFSAGGTPTWEFYDYSYNQAIINGDAIFNNYSSNNSGTISGDAIFNNNSLNQGTISGDATFNNDSNNVELFGSQNTLVTFNDSSYSSNYIEAQSVTFNDSSYNGGNITANTIFNDNSQNLLGITGNASVYYPVSRPLGGTVSGDITYFNYPTTLYFNDKDTSDGDWNNVDNWWLDEAATDPALTTPFGSEDVYIQTSITTGTSNETLDSITFEDAVANNIDLTATDFIFKGTSSNTATLTGDAVFENDASENSGTITGTVTRLYNTRTTTTRNFLTDGGRNDWIIIADGVVVDITGATYNIATNTLQTLNGGSFIEPSLTTRRSGSVSGGLSLTTPTPLPTIPTEVSEDIVQLQQQLRSLLLQLITLLQAQLEMLRGR